MGAPQRPRSRYGCGLPAVTPEQIVAAAERLTTEAGLENWTLRQLAAEIGASPAVVYHHVGDRESVVMLVLDRVVRELTVPPETLPWRAWFELLLDDHRLVLRRYPGVADRWATPGSPAAIGSPIAEKGLRLLREAGFGGESVLAYNVVLATACQHIPRDPEVFQYAVQCCLDGLENRLAKITGQLTGQLKEREL